MVSLASAMPLSFGKISCRISSGGRSSSCKVGPAMTRLRLEGSWEVLWPESRRGVADYRMTLGGFIACQGPRGVHGAVAGKKGVFAYVRKFDYVIQAASCPLRLSRLRNQGATNACFAQIPGAC